MGAGRASVYFQLGTTILWVRIFVVVCDERPRWVDRDGDAIMEQNCFRIYWKMHPCCGNSHPFVLLPQLHIAVRCTEA